MHPVLQNYKMGELYVVMAKLNSGEELEHP